MQRGKELEKLAEKANTGYKLNKQALILKVPVPIIMTAKGLVPMQSTVDFMGLTDKGRFIAYDAKETQVKTRFDLKNIKGHQLDFLKMVESLNGIAFFLI